MQINQVTLPCNDYEESVEFYKRLGLRQIVDSSPRYARFETDAGSTLSVHSAKPKAGRPDIIVYFEVEDVDALVRDLKQNGIAFESEPVDREWLWREAHLRDPAGNRLCIYHAGKNRRFPPWRITG